MRAQLYLISLLIIALILSKLFLESLYFYYTYDPNIEKYLAIDLELQINKLENDTLLKKFLEDAYRICKEEGISCKINETHIIVESKKRIIILKRGGGRFPVQERKASYLLS